VRGSGVRAIVRVESTWSRHAAYAAIKIVSGCWRDVNAAVAIIALAFAIKIAVT
jgi:hypothetical protein